MTATQPPSGASAIVRPSTTWQSHVNRFVYEYSTSMKTAIGSSFIDSGSRLAAAQNNSTKDTIINKTTSPIFNSPAGIARLAVRGFFLSLTRSMSRLSPIAALLAPNMASSTQPICAHDGNV
ncbi:hypothetical protein D3C77_651850 [compost metagenome]